MNRHRRMEAKRARRRRRLERETPVARERRQRTLAARVDAGARRLGEIVAPLERAEVERAVARLRELEKAGKRPAHDPLVSVRCDCDPPRHGRHWIRRSVRDRPGAEQQRDAWAA